MNNVGAVGIFFWALDLCEGFLARFTGFRTRFFTLGNVLKGVWFVGIAFFFFCCCCLWYIQCTDDGASHVLGSTESSQSSVLIVNLEGFCRRGMSVEVLFCVRHVLIDGTLGNVYWAYSVRQCYPGWVRWTVVSPSAKSDSDAHNVYTSLYAYDTHTHAARTSCDVPTVWMQ